MNGLRMAVEQGCAGIQRSAGTAEVEKLRERVPAEHRAAFDELLEEARHMSRMRDERGLYSDVWAAGITRRALAGTRQTGSSPQAACTSPRMSSAATRTKSAPCSRRCGIRAPTNWQNGPMTAPRSAPPTRRPSSAIRRIRRRRSTGCRRPSPG